MITDNHHFQSDGNSNGYETAENSQIWSSQIAAKLADALKRRNKRMPRGLQYFNSELS